MKIDEHMVEQFRQGDMESFYMESYPSLLRYATRVLGEPYAHMAEDCVQEAVFKVYEKRAKFDKPSEMKAYLFSAVHNEIVDLLRKLGRQEQFAGSQEWIENSPVDSYLLQETLDLLYKAIEQLPNDLKTIYNMTYEQRLKGHEIAQQLKISTTTVARQKSRLIDTLRQQFKKNDLMQLLITMILV